VETHVPGTFVLFAPSRRTFVVVRRTVVQNAEESP
jgi:hypothetical protein